MDAAAGVVGTCGGVAGVEAVEGDMGEGGGVGTLSCVATWSARAMMAGILDCSGVKLSQGKKKGKKKKKTIHMARVGTEAHIVSAQP